MKNELINIKGVLYGLEIVPVNIKGVETCYIKAIYYDDNGNRFEATITHEEDKKRFLNNK